MKTARSFLLLLAAFAAMWLVLIAAFMLVVDPYGVSPVRVAIPGINVVKPARINIDRDLKPFEVWRYQPRTVFLGTSRIHQSMDPSVLAGTRFAPAYNASIPAGSLASNIANLEQYSALSPGLKTVFVELFFWNFLGQPQTDNTPRSPWSVASDALRLFASGAAVRDAARTVLHNLKGGQAVAHIAPQGHYVYAPGHNPVGTFAAFPAGIRQMHPQGRRGFALNDAAFASFRTINALAREKGIEVIWLATPNHAYVDYYFEVLGLWDLVGEWLTRLSAEAPILSFSQPNEWVYEPVSAGMRYWNDPFHFSLEMGRAMQAQIAGLPAPAVPDNFMLGLTPDAVPGHIGARRAAIRRWAAQNRDFAMELADELGLPAAAASEALAGSVSNDEVTFEGRSYRIVQRIAGSVEDVHERPSSFILTGWAVDHAGNRPVHCIVAAVGPSIVARQVPRLPRPDIAAGIASKVPDAGFTLRVPRVPIEPSAAAPVRVFALLEDGTAVQLASNLSGKTSGMVANAPFGAAAQ